MVVKIRRIISMAMMVLDRGSAGIRIISMGIGRTHAVLRFTHVLD